MFDSYVFCNLFQFNVESVKQLLLQRTYEVELSPLSDVIGCRVVSPFRI